MTAWVSPPENPGLTLGAHLGAYRLDGFLGEGAMARVFRATDTRTGQVVALKVLKRKLATDPTYLRRFVFQLAQAVLNEQPPDPTVGRPDLPPQLCWVLLQALAKVPSHRPPSCSVFAQMLASCTTPFTA